MNQLARLLKKEHDGYLKEFRKLEASQCGKGPRKDTKVALRTFLKILKSVEPHYLSEKNILLPALEKFLTKGDIKIENLEHDLLERTSLMVGDIIADLMRHWDERSEQLAVEYACGIVKRLEHHFAIEEKYIFPTCSKLTKDQQEKILSKWGKF